MKKRVILHSLYIYYHRTIDIQSFTEQTAYAPSDRIILCLVLVIFGLQIAGTSYHKPMHNPNKLLQNTTFRSYNYKKASEYRIYK